MGFLVRPMRPFILFMCCWVSSQAVAIEPPQAALQQGQQRAYADMILITAGTFVMGSDKVETTKKAREFGNVKPWYLDEHPEHNVSLPAFYVDIYEVTNGAYREFVKAVNVSPPPSWSDNGYILTFRKQKLYGADVEKLRELAVRVFRLDLDTRAMTKEQLLDAMEQHFVFLSTLPVVSVSWQDANEFCSWVNKRLPTEQEWERVARGTSGREFPWGDEWRPGMSHTGQEEDFDATAPTGTFATDRSPEGVFDLGGNVSEWVVDWYRAYPGSDFKSDDFGETYKVARGASWSGGTGHYALHLFQRSAYRMNLPPDGQFEDVGFRCAADVKHAQK